MRIVLVLLGVLIALAGVVWTLQGAGLLLGSFMSGSSTWFWIGIASAIIGLAIAGFGVRSGASTKKA